MVMLLSKRQLPPSAATRTRRKVPPTRRRSTWALSSLLALVVLDICIARCLAASISYSSNSGNLSTSQKSPSSANNGGLVLIGSSSATSSSVPSLSLTSSSSAGLSSPAAAHPPPHLPRAPADPIATAVVDPLAITATRTRTTARTMINYPPSSRRGLSTHAMAPSQA